ncbi:MAG: molybdenum cofactor biosynthesis protein MoaE [Candidatus Krumholzibacteria bacterium]|nr:molybdenum cofactor biosynthesis protein MoaE [Candidatus Krumholzibacteria bacterium]
MDAQSTSNDMTVEITDDIIDTAAFVGELRPDGGAVVTFSGVVRNHNDGREVEGIHYDCYREMAQREGERIVDGIKEQFDVRAVRLVHRVGDLNVGEVSLLVVVTAAHRGDAFAAIEALVELVKERMPIWKKERYADKESKWL